jgi:ATP:ADP antiporter, AAA family
MHQQNSESFGKVRSYVWPIYPQELKKLLPMFIILFFVCFNYSILRNLKDAVVVTAKSSGAEVIPFIKVWVMLPAAIIMTMAFSYLSNHISRKRVFYIIILSFLTYFFLFSFVIYPRQESLQLTRLADFMQSFLPTGCKGLIAMFRNWALTIFYVMSELWGSMVLQVLFWGFANEITRISEATRFYSVLGIGSNLAAVVAGQSAVYLSTNSFDPTLMFGSTAWEQSLMKQIIIILVSGVCILITFHWMTRNVLNNPQYMPEETRQQKKKEKKLSFYQSLEYIANSKYLLCIAAMVVSYNLVINLVEVIWKDKLRLLCPDPHEYNMYMNNLTSAMGLISTSASLVMVGIIRKLGWTNTALTTPIVLLVTTLAFFGCLIADSTLGPVVSIILGTTPLALAVMFGSIQNCFTKAAKYSLFDTTKEMAFVPLSPEHKLKGKAAIDGIGSKMGKSGGSLVHQGLLLVFTTVGASTPYVGAILIGVIVVWITAVRSLGRQFAALAEIKEEKEHEAEKDLIPTPTITPSPAQTPVQA